MRACVLFDFDFARALHRSEERLPLIGKEFCSRMKQRKAANSSLKKKRVSMRVTMKRK